MKERTSIFHRSYSFLAWLVVPMLLAWLGTNYVIGALTVIPSWAQAQGTATTAPVVVVYPHITDTGHGLVTLWFDDAWKSQYAVAEPIIRAAGMAAAIAVPASYVGYDAYLNWEQLQALQQDGWEITDHSDVHDCTMQNWSDKKIDADLTHSLQTLWTHRLAAQQFVSPCGVSSPSLVAQSKKEFASFRGVEPGYNDLHALDLTNLRVRNVTDEVTAQDIRTWLYDARAHDYWLILVFHQIGKGDVKETNDLEKYATPVETFTAAINYIKTSGVQVVVPAQALALATST